MNENHPRFNWAMSLQLPRKSRLILTIFCLALLTVVLTACGGDDISVFFTNIENGDVVSSPVTLQWDAENFTIEPTGEVRDGAGHLHVLVDVPCIPAGGIIPSDDNHHHFGAGQTEATLELSPGSHFLCLQAGDGTHIALPGEGATQTITIVVQ